MTTQPWIAGEPGWTNTKCRYDAPDRDAAARQHARVKFNSTATVVHEGRGWYAVTYEWFGVMITAPRAFRVQRPPNQSRRGLDEAAARDSLLSGLAPCWAIPEASLDGAGSQRSPRTDLLVLPDHGTSLGIEIKTDRDTLSRLSGQVERYSRAYARCAVAVTPRHLGRLHVPAWWGVAVLDPDTHQVQGWQRCPEDRPERFTVAHLVAELWGDELTELLRPHRLPGLHQMDTRTRAAALVDVLGPRARAAALATLAARQGTRVSAIRRDRFPVG